MLYHMLKLLSVSEKSSVTTTKSTVANTKYLYFYELFDSRLFVITVLVKYELRKQKDYSLQ